MSAKHQSYSADTPSWRELYRAALFEADRQKLPSRIDKAERAIRLRTAELSAAAGDHVEETQAVEDALYALKALRNALELNTHEPPP
jgi:hypothetical protein